MRNVMSLLLNTLKQLVLVFIAEQQHMWFVFSSMHKGKSSFLDAVQLAPAMCYLCNAMHILCVLSLQCITAEFVYSLQHHLFCVISSMHKKIVSCLYTMQGNSA